MKATKSTSWGRRPPQHSVPTEVIGDWMFIGFVLMFIASLFDHQDDIGVPLLIASTLFGIFLYANR